MIIETKGYSSLIEYLADNLGIFTTQNESVGKETIEHIVMDLVTSNIIAIFEYNPELSQEIHFELLGEVDSIIADLEEVFASSWNKKATNEQIVFLEEYVSLIKNLFDSAIAQHY